MRLKYLRIVRRRFAAASLPSLFGNNVPDHTTRKPQVGFELATNSIQFYAIANVDKLSFMWSSLFSVIKQFRKN